MTLFVSGLFFAVGRLWEKTLKPRLQTLWWRGPNIAGEWEFFDRDPSTAGGQSVGIVKITQHASRITAVATRTLDRDGNSVRRTFDYEGSFSAPKLTLLFEARDRPAFIMGALVLHLDDAARHLHGLTIYDKAGQGVIQHEIWYRKLS